VTLLQKLLKYAVPYIQELLRHAHSYNRSKGYEADDLIGTIAKQAEKRNYKVFMVTPDKDFAQLVSETFLCTNLPVWVMASKYGEF
jgi:5'-3' exonuclease